MFLFRIKNYCATVHRQLFCYFFLLYFFIQWDQYKTFWSAKQTAVRMHNDGGKGKHFFIYSTFLYNQRPPEKFKFGKIKLVVLYLAERTTQNVGPMECFLSNNEHSKISVKTEKEMINSLGRCALELFLLTCTIDKIKQKSDMFSNISSPRVFGLVLQNEFESKKIMLNPKQPSYKPRQLVLCMSRIILFERWQLLITCLEAYRQFKVDLVVTYMQSALLSVFELLRAYEENGMLKIEPGIRFPHQRGMKWDPNAETEFNGQILLAHDCFYEYRESAQFIGLIDWDDLLVPSKHFAKNLPSAFSAAFAQNKDTAYFLVNKIEASFVEQKVQSPSTFSLDKLLEYGIRTADIYNDEKMVVRPKALRGFWMHSSQHVLPYKRAVQLLTNYSILLHLANDERVNSDEYQNAFMTKFDIEDMSSHAKRLLRNFSTKLPSSQLFYNALVQCHSQIYSYLKSTGILRIDSTRCHSYSLCEVPRVPEAMCAVTRSIFETVVLAGAEVVTHIRKTTDFGQEKCTDFGI